MSIALATGDTITGLAGSATSITYTISGDEIAAGADAFKVLAQGQLPSSVGTLYTVPASTEAIVKTIHLANMTAGTVTARLNVKGTAAANAILPPISILAGGFAVYADDGWRVYNDQGQLLSVGATGATGAAGGVFTVKDEGTPLATDASSMDFVGGGVVASGAGADKTITIPGVTGVTFSIVVVFDAGADAITGSPEVDVMVPAAGTITSWTLFADAAGSAVIDIWNDTYANFAPTVADTITAAAKPTLAAAAKATDATLAGWTTSLAAGDVLRFHLDSSSTVKRLELTLTYTRS